MIRVILAAGLSLAATAALAQETPTERDAARSVVQKRMELQRSLNLDALVTKLTGPNAARNAVAARAKQLMDTELLALADDITRHPEIGFVERRSVQKLTEYLERHNFDVKKDAGGLETAFVARYEGTRGPNLGVILEYDALRGTVRRSMAISTARKGRWAWRPRSPWLNISRGRKTPGSVTSTERLARK